MATTSPDNLYSPDSSDPYALTQDLGAMQDSVQSALVRRANAYVGTSAQRNAFTTAPVGTIWSDTNGSRLVYKRGASSWEPVSPAPDYRVVRSGTVSIPSGTLTLIPNSGGIYAVTLSYTVPFSLESNEKIITSSEQVGNGWGIISQNGVIDLGGSTRVDFRFIQVASAASQTVRIVWMVVKTS